MNRGEGGGWGGWLCAPHLPALSSWSLLRTAHFLSQGTCPGLRPFPPVLKHLSPSSGSAISPHRASITGLIVPGDSMRKQGTASSQLQRWSKEDSDSK